MPLTPMLPTRPLRLKHVPIASIAYPTPQSHPPRLKHIPDASDTSPTPPTYSPCLQHFPYSSNASPSPQTCPKRLQLVLNTSSAHRTRLSVLLRSLRSLYKDKTEITEGMWLDRRFISPYFIMDVKTQEDVICAVVSQALVIIAENVDGKALAACILNKLRGQPQVAAIKAPGFGDNRKLILGGLTILTGGTVFTDELDIKLKQATPDPLRSTGSITITKENAINGEGSKDGIQVRCEQICALLADPSTSNFDETKLQERVIYTVDVPGVIGVSAYPTRIKGYTAKIVPALSPGLHGPLLTFTQKAS
ncbi:GroEL apical domain-like protein [Imleria badia]|nr:GroEL apical domain-like protein [Imleria badia]